MIFKILVFMLINISADAGTPGEIFTYGFGAKAFAFGGAFTAVDGEPEAAYFNPASTFSGQRGNILISYSSPHWLHSYGGGIFTYPIGPTMGFDFAIFGLKTNYIIGARDEFGRYISEWYNYLEAGGLLGFSRKIKDFLAVGANLKFYYSHLATYTGSGVGLDFGLLLMPKSFLNIGFSWLNLIPPRVKMYKEAQTFPPVIRLGLQFRPFSKMRVLADYIQSTARNPKVALGAEVTPVSFLAVRMGYNPYDISVGFGFLTHRGGFDYEINYTFSNNISSEVLYAYTHRISVTAKFGGYRVWAHADPENISLRIGAGPHVLTYIYPHVKTRAPVKSWVLRIYTQTGEVAREFKGDLTPPLRIDWDGRDQTGRLVPRGKYYYKIIVRDVKGNIYRGEGYLLRVVETSIF